MHEPAIPGATMKEIERFAIERTLHMCLGSTADAARVLGISQRTIQYRIKQWQSSLPGVTLP